MENKMPIPTDNIFKFYALFGLTLFIFSAGSIIYVNHSTNELVFQSAPELGELQQTQNPLPFDAVKKRMLEERLEVAASDRKFFTLALGVFLGAGLILMYCGFRTWHTKVQPVQDEMARLQLEKLRHEVRQLKHLNSKSEKSVHDLASKQ